MRRHPVAGAVVVCLAATFALSGCAAKTADGGAAAYRIEPLFPVEIDGSKAATAVAGTVAEPAGDGRAVCAPNTTIAYAGPLTGGNSALGVNIFDSVKLVVALHNRANPACQVKLRQFDTEGDPQKATQVIPQVISDPSIVGLVGPTFSGESKATAQTLSDAGLVAVSPSATNATLTKQGWKTFFRGLANDDVQGPSVARYLTGTAGFKKVCVIRDNTDYGTGLARSVTDGLGSVADRRCAAGVKTGDRDFSATTIKIAAQRPDAVFYAGYYQEAAPLVQQLRSDGVEATFVSADGSNDPQFLEQAGNSAKGAILSCPCGPASAEFAVEFERFNKQPPGVYSIEGYDLTTILMRGIDAGKTARADLVDYVRSYDGHGLARHYKWNSDGELARAQIWMYQVE